MPLLKQLLMWDSDCEYYLMKSLDGYAEFFKNEVNCKKAQLWEVDNGDTYFITRTERDEKNKRILVVCCYEGRDIENVYKLMENSCYKLGFFAIRFHTKRKGMIKLGLKHGFKILEQRGYETVLIKYLMH